MMVGLDDATEGVGGHMRSECRAQCSCFPLLRRKHRHQHARPRHPTFEPPQERESTTLYVAYTGAAGYSSDQLQHLLAENFKEWGPLRGPPFVVASKAIAFVRFHWRASAEFAKEAMHGQGLDGSKFDVGFLEGPCLWVGWMVHAMLQALCPAF
jgi:hypothetical protein